MNKTQYATRINSLNSRCVKDCWLFDSLNDLSIRYIKGLNISTLENFPGLFQVNPHANMDDSVVFDVTWCHLLLECKVRSMSMIISIEVKCGRCGGKWRSTGIHLRFVVNSMVAFVSLKHQILRIGFSFEKMSRKFTHWIVTPPIYTFFIIKILCVWQLASTHNQQVTFNKKFVCVCVWYKKPFHYVWKKELINKESTCRSDVLNFCWFLHTSDFLIIFRHSHHSSFKILNFIKSTIDINRNNLWKKVIWFSSYIHFGW